MKELRKAEEHNNLSSAGQARGTSGGAPTGGVASATAGARKVLKKPTFFLTENQTSVEELLHQTPFIFQFVPSKATLQKLIVRGSQLKSAKELEEKQSE